jgi:RNA polymerase sigma-70 factor, ECF subfamily
VHGLTGTGSRTWPGERVARVGSVIDFSFRRIVLCVVMRFDGALSIPFVAPQQRSECDQVRLRTAFDQNFAGVWRFLRRMGVPHDRADDAAQQVFLIALEALTRISEGSERAFIYATAVRLAHGVRRKGEREIASAAFECDPSPLPSPDQLTDQKRSREVLDAIVTSMDVDIRTVFVLAEFDGFTTPEIAGLLEIPLGTAASRLRRARARFQELARAAYGDLP